MALVSVARADADVPAFTLGSVAALGVTHRYSSMQVFTDEVSQARIWAGFHYRFSTRVGQEMGRASATTS